MMFTMSNRTRGTSAGLLVLASAAAVWLSGCGEATPVAKVQPARGIVLGGQQPVAFVNLQFYTVGSGSYGAAATPLGPAFQTTGAGNFNLPAYTCPGNNPEAFLVGTGGTPIGGSPNPNLALMAGLGPCNSIASISYLTN
jgi:hypothetical protein